MQKAGGLFILKRNFNLLEHIVPCELLSFLLYLCVQNLEATDFFDYFPIEVI